MAERSNFLGRTTKASNKQSWAAVAASLGRISTICSLDSATTSLEGGGRFSLADGGKTCSGGGFSSLDGGLSRLNTTPNYSILGASLGTWPSYTWRSILSSIPYLKKRVLLRIGDGATAIIGVNPWLPSAPLVR
ncbi:hypothetical protein L6164_002801 [Bauhinia variegata]|uniref:Uncharacterized protein n=1 Tax=Bauhinia variegata TaxID=167791 RepID=A0ACB9PZE8_BAUVA|nr:hypothetical protein L6164_002801 [Bauhinia variegata]